MCQTSGLSSLLGTIERQLQRRAGWERVPAFEQGAHARPHARQLSFSKYTGSGASSRCRKIRCVLVKLGGGPFDATRALQVQHPDHVLHRERFIRARPPRASSTSLFHIPTLGYKPVETASKAKLTLHRVVSEVVQREERRLPPLMPLPRGGSVRSDAPYNRAAIGALGDVDHQLGQIRVKFGSSDCYESVLGRFSSVPVASAEIASTTYVSSNDHR